MANNALAGKLGFVNAGGASDLELTKWGTAPEVDLLDTTNFTSGGWEQNIMGIAGADINVEGYYTTTAGGVLVLGAEVAVTLGAGALTFFDGTAIVKSKPIECEVRGRVGMTCTLRLQGAPNTLR